MESSSTEKLDVSISVDAAELHSEEMETKHMLEEEQSFSSSYGECRICQVEDSIDEMEAPCRCNGTLKFAHRDCIQQWINLRYKTTCEICIQPYEGGYTITVPPPALPPQPTRREVVEAIRARRAYVAVDAEIYRARLNAANSAILGRSVLCRIAPFIAAPEFDHLHRLRHPSASGRYFSPWNLLVFKCMLGVKRRLIQALRNTDALQWMNS